MISDGRWRCRGTAKHALYAPGADLFGIMMVSQVINGVLLPVLLLCMVNIASNRHVMGSHVNGRIWNTLTWFTIVAVIILTVVMFVFQVLGY